MKKFTIYNNKGGFIQTRIYPKSKLPKNVPKKDVIRLICGNDNQKDFIDTFVYPKEALFIATQLMKAWLYYDSKQSFRQGRPKK